MGPDLRGGGGGGTKKPDSVSGTVQPQDITANLEQILCHYYCLKVSSSGKIKREKVMALTIS